MQILLLLLYKNWIEKQITTESDICRILGFYPNQVTHTIQKFRDAELLPMLPTFGPRAFDLTEKGNEAVIDAFRNFRNKIIDPSTREKLESPDYQSDLQEQMKIVIPVIEKFVGTKFAKDPWQFILRVMGIIQESLPHIPTEKQVLLRSDIETIKRIVPRLLMEEELAKDL